MKEVEIPNIGKLSGELGSMIIGDVIVRRDSIQIVAKAVGKMHITVSR